MLNRQLAVLMAAVLLVVAGCGSSKTSSSSAKGSPSITGNETCDAFVAQSPRERAIALHAAGVAGSDTVIFYLAAQTLQQECSNQGPYFVNLGPGTTINYVLSQLPASVISTGIAPSTTAPASGSGAVTTVAFTATSGEGWTYAGTIDIPRISIVLSKDVTSSPPGYARISVSASSSSQGQLPTFADTNAGRPNGPMLEPFISVFYDISQISYQEFDYNRMPSSFYDCSTEGDPTNPKSLHEGGDEFTCNFPFDNDNQETGQYPEASVDKLISVFNSTTPIYILNMDSLAGWANCRYDISSSGVVSKNPLYATNCGLQASVRTAGT